MKLIVQIPCLNEEKTLPITVKDIPRKIDGIDEVEILIIDDGSSDRTVEIAKEVGVNYIVSLKKNKGLAKSFMAGIEACLIFGADIIVNTDADRQYKGEDIPRLIKPILEKKADIVIGVRNVDTIPYFSLTKRFFQKLGSWVVRQISDTDISDATSGFRAFSREAALQLNTFSDFTYTLETIIQAGYRRMKLDYIHIEVNEKTRESRLFSSIWSYIKGSVSTIFRIYVLYRPLKTFSIISGALFSIGILLILRFIYFYFTVPGPTGHIQSLIVAAILMTLGFQVFVIALVAELISANRKLIEDCLYKIKKFELSVFSKEKKVEENNTNNY